MKKLENTPCNVLGMGHTVRLFLIWHVQLHTSVTPHFFHLDFIFSYEK